MVSWRGLEALSAQHARLVLPLAQDWAVFYRGLGKQGLALSGVMAGNAGDQSQGILQSAFR